MSREHQEWLEPNEIKHLIKDMLLPTTIPLTEFCWVKGVKNYIPKYANQPIHLYLDSSGSVLDRNLIWFMVAKYICIAKTLGCDLYITSFSHLLGPTYKIRVADRTVNSDLTQARQRPMVDGGTDIEMIWDYINESDTRLNEISIVLTDYGFGYPNQNVTTKHPPLLFYDQMFLDDYGRKVTESFKPDWIEACIKHFNDDKFAIRCNFRQG